MIAKTGENEYCKQAPNDAPLPILWKPSAEPPTKRTKIGSGRPRKTSDSSQTVMVADSDREENESNSSITSTGEVEGKNSPSMMQLHGTKQKTTVVAYAKMHSIAAAAKHFTIPRTTIVCWKWIDTLRGR